MKETHIAQLSSSSDIAALDPLLSAVARRRGQYGAMNGRGQAAHM